VRLAAGNRYREAEAEDEQAEECDANQSGGHGTPRRFATTPGRLSKPNGITDQSERRGLGSGRESSDKVRMGVLSKLAFWRGPYGTRSRRQRAAIGLVLGVLSVIPLSAGVVWALRWIDPPTSAFMLRAQREARAEGRSDFRLRRYWVDWEHIAPAARVAVVAAEDQRFLSHDGFDLESIADAVYERVTEGRSRGASTVSQQVAKNLFLWPGKSFVRKGLEAWFTLWIEMCWPKERVLEIYLNVAQFGDGIYGVEAASIVFFRKSADELTPREAATLAAVLPNPVRFHAERPSKYVKSRSRWILAQMQSLEGTGSLGSLARR
jgi:monofunctional biosynthetic peptidoglycan transglycosylase